MYIFIMGFLTKVKYNYYQNAFDDLKKTTKLKKLFNYLIIYQKILMIFILIFWKKI